MNCNEDKFIMPKPSEIQIFECKNDKVHKPIYAPPMKIGDAILDNRRVKVKP